MKIGIDIDDTITDSYDLIVDTFADCNSIDKTIFYNNKMSYKEIEKRFNNYLDFSIMTFEKIMPHVKLKDNVKETINTLHKLGYSIEIVSARNKTEYSNPYELTYKYLKENGIYFDHIHTNVFDKGAFCQTHNIKILIDDSIENLNKAKKHGIKPILFNNIFNEDCHDFIRLNNWLDLITKNLTEL